MLTGTVMNIWMPINKNLWTSTFTVFMAGISTGMFTLFYWFIDVQGHKRWAKPFEIYGRNALAAYIVSGMIARLAEVIKIGNIPLQTWVYRNVLLPIASPKRASVLYALAKRSSSLRVQLCALSQKMANPALTTTASPEPTAIAHLPAVSIPARYTPSGGSQ